jgi:ABC-2 type transport system permease protein
MKFINTLRRIFFRELKTIFTDGGAILLFLVANFAYPLVYSCAYMNEELQDVSVCLVDKDNTKSSRELIKYLDASSELKVSESAISMKEAMIQFEKGKVNAVFRIPDDFERKILSSEQSPVSMYCDGAYFLYYKACQKALVKATGIMSENIEIKRLMERGMDYHSAKDAANLVDLKVFNEYNPSGGYGSFLIPGIIFLILQQTLLIGIGLLGGSMKEKNYFRFYKVFDNKIGGIPALILGKSLAYTTVYLFNFILSLYVLNDLFGFPEKGLFINQLALVIPYILSVSFLGLAMSTLFKTRVHSMMFLVFLSPLLLFTSGISWPIESIPMSVRALMSIFPSQQAIPAFLRLKIMGVGLERISFEYIFIIVQMLIYFLLACFAYKKLIHKK